MQESRLQNRTQITKQVTLVGALVNIVLSVVKVVFGFIAQSQALIVDGIHSLSDLLSDAMVWFASYHADFGPDEKHPYGHGRFETGATLGLGVLLILVAAGIVWDGTGRLFRPEKLLHPGLVALLIAILSVLIKEVLYQYTMRVGRKVGSKMIQANAWHHRSDAISSIVVVIGIAGTIAGLPYLDSVAAVVVGVMIAHVGWELGWSAFEELMDVGLESEGLARVKEIVHSVDGVKAVHTLRTRSIGGEIAVDLHVQVEHWLSVSEGHMIGQTVMDLLMEQVDDIGDVTVHIDSEDDETGSPTKGLPLRREILAKLDQSWQAIPRATNIKRTILHYIDGKIDIDIYFPLSCYDGEKGLDDLRAQLQEPLQGYSEFRRLNIFFG